MKKSKKYDAVAEVRKIRDELGPRYWNDREFMWADLKRASEEFNRRMEGKKEAEKVSLFNSTLINTTWTSSK